MYLREIKKDKKTQRHKDTDVIQNFMFFKNLIIVMYGEILYICTAQVRGRKTTGGSTLKPNEDEPLCET